MSRVWIAALLLMCLAPVLPAQQPDQSPDRILSRYKQASGGERWDAVRTLQSSGTLSAGGLSGELHVTHELTSGRYRSDYSLGPIDGADGYDGHSGWSRDPGGEVAVRDGPEAVRKVRTQAWFDARAFWYPQRMAATFTGLGVRELDGRRHLLVEAHPQGGDPVVLWFVEDTGLLARSEQPQGADTAITTVGDYREIDGLLLPFHIVTDLMDPAGVIDPRRRVEIRLREVRIDVAVADGDFTSPTMRATARIDDPARVARIPFELVNNHIYVDGRIDGQAVRLLVDTGGVNLLTPAAADRLGLKSEGRLAAAGAGEERVDLGFARTTEIRVGAAVLAEPVFYILDLGELEHMGPQFDGLVGYEMFRRFGVEIDYENRILSLSDPAVFAPPTDATVVPFHLEERIPVVTGKLDGLEARFSIDTGSRASLTLHSPFVREHDLVRRYRAGPESVMGWGVGGASRGRPVRLGALELGEQRIEGLVGDLYAGTTGAFAAPGISANLGGGVLRRFTVTFDYEARRMYLKPNRRFGEPDEFDRGGMWFMVDGAALRIADVAQGSAAARAGLRVGDRVLEIDGVATADRPLADWQTLLRERPAGTTLRIAYERAGKPANVRLTLADRVPPAK